MKRLALAAGLALAAALPAVGAIYGVNSHVAHGGYTAAQANSAMLGVGLSTFREPYYWGSVEWNKGIYSAGGTLAEVEKHISVAPTPPLIILCCNNRHYTTGGLPSTPEQRAAFVKYAVWTATRLKGKVFDYEVWNEWNIGANSWSDVRYGDPVQYVALLKEVYAALKGVDPNIRVVGGAIAGWDDKWTEEMLRAGGGQYMDVISIHPYAYPHPPEQHIAYLKRFRDLVNFYRPGLPIYITEIGWPNHTGDKATAEWKASVFLTRFYLLLGEIDQVKGVWWYNVIDSGTDRTNREHNFGLLRADMTPKLPACTMRETQKALRGSKYISGATFSKAGVSYRRVTYQNCDASYTHAVWAEAGGGTVTVTVPAGGFKEVQCEPTTRSAMPGTRSFYVGISPVLIRTDSLTITLE